MRRRRRCRRRRGTSGCGCRRPGRRRRRPASAGRCRPTPSCRPARRPTPPAGRRRWPPPSSPAATSSIRRHDEGVQADLADAVELVAAEVEQHDHVGSHRRRRLGQQALVDLEGHDRRPAARRTGRPTRPGQEVGAGGVGLHRPPGGQGGGQQPGGGGLAVGARDEGHLVAGGHQLEGRGVDGQRHPPADDGARAPPRPPRDLRRRPGRRGRPARVRSGRSTAGSSPECGRLRTPGAGERRLG